MITRNRTEYHITLEQAKRQAKIEIDFVDDDDYLRGLIKAAVKLAENYGEKAIALTTCTMVLNDFTGSLIYVPEGNFISVTSITDQDSGNHTQKRTLIYDDHFVIELDNAIEAEELTIVFEAGYAVDMLPEDIKQAVLIKLDDLYNTERGNYTLPLQNNKTFERILDFYKPYRFNYYRTT